MGTRYWEHRVAAVPHDAVVLSFYVDDLSREERYKVDDRLFARAWPEWVQRLGVGSPLWRGATSAVGIRDATFLHYRSRSYREALGDGLARIERLRQAVTDSGRRFAVLNVPYFDWAGTLESAADYRFRDLDAVVRGWCAERSVPYLEVLPRLVGRDIEALRVAPGDVHLNDAGHRLAAEALRELTGQWRR